MLVLGRPTWRNFRPSSKPNKQYNYWYSNNNCLYSQKRLDVLSDCCFIERITIIINWFNKQPRQPTSQSYWNQTREHWKWNNSRYRLKFEPVGSQYRRRVKYKDISDCSDSRTNGAKIRTFILDQCSHPYTCYDKWSSNTTSNFHAKSIKDPVCGKCENRVKNGKE